MANNNGEAVADSSRVIELRKRHAALSAKVEALHASPGADDLEITNLKKQKLRIKEEIHRLTTTN